MADNRKYYYLKLKEDFFDTDEMKISIHQPAGIAQAFQIEFQQDITV